MNQTVTLQKEGHMKFKFKISDGEGPGGGVYRKNMYPLIQVCTMHSYNNFLCHFKTLDFLQIKVFYYS